MNLTDREKSKLSNGICRTCLYDEACAEGLNKIGAINVEVKDGVIVKCRFYRKVKMIEYCPGCGKPIGYDMEEASKGPPYPKLESCSLAMRDRDFHRCDACKRKERAAISRHRAGKDKVGKASSRRVPKKIMTDAERFRDDINDYQPENREGWGDESIESVSEHETDGFGIGDCEVCGAIGVRVKDQKGNDYVIAVCEKCLADI